MKKIFFAAVLLCFSLCSLYAQELTMSDFHVDSSDLSAQVHQVADLNGDPCALIKVGLTVPDAKFEGDIVKSEYKDGSEAPVGLLLKPQILLLYVAILRA